ncbi:hypothetical protein CXB51_029410 [Gossypium anomalum]|uniref:RNase H type-1 domain-containing protein n=1 Tax=Gossypium anomalum TaxID=47600 RepID=A0A8J6CP91_9ROSI|nr:hypothetical protein CXB51_029410 [Gossypium anomalum]
MIVDNCCLRCHDHSESNIHIVRDCCLAKQVWMNLNYHWPNSVADFSFNEWLNWLLENSSSGSREEIAISIWAIWHSRNKFVHEKITQTTDEVVTFIKGFSMEHRELSSKSSTSQTQGYDLLESPSNGLGKAKCGCRFLDCKTESVAFAEAIALLHDVQFASEMGFRYVIAESDSRLVINNINSKEDDYSETRPLTWDLKASTRNFSECRFQFVAREGNSVAHAMAEEGLRRLEDCFWVEDAPVKASDLAASDRRSHRPP